MVVTAEHHFDAKHKEDGRMTEHRSCTDIICVLIFAVFLAGFGYVAGYGVKNGDPKRLTHGFNYNGSLCGVDPGFENAPLLYYCPNSMIGAIPQGLNLKAPICVSACPTSDNQTVWCMSQTSVTPTVIGSAQTVTLTQGLVLTQTYATKEVLGAYCIPDAKKLSVMAKASGSKMGLGLRASLFNSTGPLGNSNQKIHQYFGSLKRCVPLLMISLVFTVVMSYTFLLLLKWFARPLLYTVLTFLFLFFLGGAGFFLIGEQLPRPVSKPLIDTGSTLASADMTVATPVVVVAASVAVTAAPVAVTTPAPWTGVKAGPTTGVSVTAGGRRLVSSAEPRLVSSVEELAWMEDHDVLSHAMERHLLSYVQACAEAPEQCAALEDRWAEYGGRKNWENANPFYNEHLPLDQAKYATYVAGGAFALVGFVFAILLCCAKKSIDTAIGCVKAAVDCLWAIPPLLIMPAIEVAVKVALYATLLTLLAFLISAGQVGSKSYMTMPNGQEVSGLRRHFEYSDEQKVYVGFYVFMMFWILELMNAMGQFVTSYAVVDWYYTEKSPTGYKAHHCFSVVQGLLYGWTFHLGTLAMGSFLIALCRFVRLVLMMIERMAKAEGNAALACIAKCLACIITCFKKFFEMINKNAYIDVCINSTNFCTAASNSMAFILSPAAGAIVILHGACAIFSIGGTMAISSATGFVTYQLITTQERWTSETSPHHVVSPEFVALVATVGAVFISASFMVVFDHTADTLLYTFCWNKSKAHNTVGMYAPNCLLDKEEKEGADHVANALNYKPLVAVKSDAAKKDESHPGNFWHSMFGSHHSAETTPLIQGHK